MIEPIIPAVLASLRGILNEDFTGELRGLHKKGVPALAIWGQDDAVIPPTSPGRLAERARPENAMTLISDTYSHKVHVTRDNRSGDLTVSIEGDRNARIKLDRAPWSLNKAWRKVGKHAVWLVIAFATGGAWILYFHDAWDTLANFFTGTAAPSSYVFAGVLTFTTYTLAGTMREQVCTYMCPWPRIQAAMMDEETLTVGYRYWRGEPRGKGKRKTAAEGAAEPVTRAAGPVVGRKYPPTPMPNRQSDMRPEEVTEGPGDCIDCMACVNVCPMGIDIRNGQQLECITCALCIDACDDVMTKIGKPRGLIDYMALTDEQREREGQPPKPVIRHILRPRTILYTSLWSLVGVGLLFALFIRSEIDMTVAPVRNPTFVMLSDGSVRNTYEVGIRNKHGESRPFYFSLGVDSPFTVNVEGSVETMLVVDPDTEGKTRLYVTAPAGSEVARDDRTEIRIWVIDGVTGDRASHDTVFNGRGQ